MQFCDRFDPGGEVGRGERLRPRANACCIWVDRAALPIEEADLDRDASGMAGAAPNVREGEEMRAGQALDLQDELLRRTALQRKRGFRRSENRVAGFKNRPAL